MKKSATPLVYLMICAVAALLVAVPAAAEVCEGFGPQTPRNISSKDGENARAFSAAPAYDHMNLCNIHFHKHAEHKGPGFSVFAGEGDHGGWACNDASSLTEAEKAPAGDVCNGLQPGDTVEVHWVHSSCAITPGPTLGACLSDACGNPDLRVETQVFLLVNDEDALDFADFAYGGNVVNGLHQAKAIPSGTGEAVQFAGSTTGPKFTEQTCSPLQVSWSVRPQCAKLDISSLGKWCEDNVFNEDHGHGVRQLVTDKRLLSQIH